MANPAPFSRFEWMIAWRYLRAKRAEGGVSVMTWISLIGITLAVFALIATLAVRSGFRAEFIDTILGANAHATIYSTAYFDGAGAGSSRNIPDFAEMAARIGAAPGVVRAAPLVKGQVMASANGNTSGIEVHGIRPEDLATVPRIVEPLESQGSLSDFGGGGPDEGAAAATVAIGSGVARELGVGVGDIIRLISPDGARTPFGTTPRVSNYAVAYIFTAGRFDIDRTRIYLPFTEAQTYFNAEGTATEIEVMLDDPETVADFEFDILQAAGPEAVIWSWRDASGAFLRALDIEDNVMFVILSVLVLIASMNIVSGLIMLVKNKGRDIGILRTVGLTEGSILRIFFICGSLTGIIGTVLGVILGVAFAIWIDPIFSAVNYLSGGGAWDPSIRGIYALPAKLQWGDVLSAVVLSLSLSFIVTIFPARRAARMNPVEALRYE